MATGEPKVTPLLRLNVKPLTVVVALAAKALKVLLFTPKVASADVNVTVVVPDVA